MCVFLLFQTFPTSTSHSKVVYSSSNLKASLKPGAGSKPHDVQEALKKKQVLYYSSAGWHSKYFTKKGVIGN